MNPRQKAKNKRRKSKENKELRKRYPHAEACLVKDVGVCDCGALEVRRVVRGSSAPVPAIISPNRPSRVGMTGGSIPCKCGKFSDTQEGWDADGEAEMDVSGFVIKLHGRDKCERAKDGPYKETVVYAPRLSALADEVLEMDKQATAGPWETDGVYDCYVFKKPVGNGVTIADNSVKYDEEAPEGSVVRARGTGAGLTEAQQGANMRLVAKYRTAAVELAGPMDLLLEIHTEATNLVPFLETIKDSKARDGELFAPTRESINRLLKLLNISVGGEVDDPL